MQLVKGQGWFGETIAVTIDTTEKAIGMGGSGQTGIVVGAIGKAGWQWFVGQQHRHPF
ncbi:hypothetical protein [Desulfatitalea alkaliphila]|uniref:Uncharacterized protein n=1 Tax=Desulfatitalea alkaliphila TaxID=2929485 RepID=A0AA41R2T5_9BACT|nr:hypothetical protein [Desulfatitalea alkaliphila]MCJ8501022.1 hypothetical protein [Desulfatitalea alkaliphila]